MSKEFPVLHDLISPPSSLMCSWFSSHTGSFSVLQTCQHRSHYDVHKWWSFCSQNSSLDLEMTTCSFIIIQFSFQMQGPRCVSQSHPPPQQHVLNRAASRLFIHSSVPASPIWFSHSVLSFMRTRVMSLLLTAVSLVPSVVFPWFVMRHQNKG